MQRKTFIQQTSLLAGMGFLMPESIFSSSTDSPYKQLAEHRIVKEEQIEYAYHWPRLVGRNAKRDVHGQHHKNVAIKLYTDKGAAGWGLGGPDRSKETPSIIGKSVAELINPASGIKDGVSRKYDLALYDLAGIILDLPVYKLLGAKGNKETNLYSGMIYLDELPSENHRHKGGMDVVLANCQWDYNYGYRQLKIKIGRSGKWYPHDEGLQKDIEVVNSIWNEYKNKNVQLLVDANDAYSLEDAKQFLKGVKDVPLYWLEEPFAENPETSRQLKQWMNENGFSKILYADGEANTNYEYCMQLLKEKSLDVMLVDTVGHGFSRWISLQNELQSMGVLSSPHAWGDKLKTNYTAHLAAGLGGIETIEGVTCFSEDIDYGDYKLENGKIRVSDKPGFGMTLLKKA